MGKPLAGEEKGHGIIYVLYMDFFPCLLKGLARTIQWDLWDMDMDLLHQPWISRSSLGITRGVVRVSVQAGSLGALSWNAIPEPSHYMFKLGGPSSSLVRVSVQAGGFGRRGF